MMTAIAVGLLVVMGGVWLSDTLGGVRIGNLEPVYLQAGAFVLVVAVFGFLGYYLIGCKAKFVDFLIATEGEMKKVNWSTRREIIGSTWVVIGLTVVVAVIISVLDFLVYSPIFRAIHVLETTG
ncbi:MAG: preprotein translocase subunit SecE, partial [Planctomycetota bacterium]|jgi:preprotein translocase SecE subunit